MKRAAAAPEPARTATTPPDGGAAPLSPAARAMAAAPPVDHERVARIRKAIEDGRFPILPATIADRLLAFSLEWNPHDPA